MRAALSLPRPALAVETECSEFISRKYFHKVRSGTRPRWAESYRPSRELRDKSFSSPFFFFFFFFSEQVGINEILRRGARMFPAFPRSSNFPVGVIPYAAQLRAVTFMAWS